MTYEEVFVAISSLILWLITIKITLLISKIRKLPLRMTLITIQSLVIISTKVIFAALITLDSLTVAERRQYMVVKILITAIYIILGIILVAIGTRYKTQYNTNNYNYMNYGNQYGNQYSNPNNAYNNYNNQYGNPNNTYNNYSNQYNNYQNNYQQDFNNTNGGNNL
jgi:ABC-type transport system involved in multi-copper enzyme maturation permease subunit